MIYSRTDLTGERPPLLLQPPPLLLPRLPLTAKRTHRLCGIPSATAAAVLAHTLTCTLFSFLLFFFLQVLFMSEWLGLCVCGLPCPLKRALINDYFINQGGPRRLKAIMRSGLCRST